MRLVKWTLGGQEYYMAYTMEAMISLEETDGSVGDMIARIAENSREGIDTLCRCVEILTREGGMVRRAAGYKESDIPEEKHFRPFITPKVRAALAEAVTRAVSIGLMTEEESEEETDVVLLQLQKKTEIKVEAGRKPTA